jgi:hypothetical protein
MRKSAFEEAVREIKDNTCQLAKRQIGKIVKLRGAGWDLRRTDATEAFIAVMTSSRGTFRNLGEAGAGAKREDCEGFPAFFSYNS